MDGTERIDLPWWPTGRGRASEREPLSRQQIVAAAIRLIDEDGLDELSMRRLGQELGSGATSLYWHVRSKEDLLLLVVDEIAGEINGLYEARAAGTWQDHARTFARAVREVVAHEHPRAAILFVRRMALGPNVLRGMDELLGALRRGGLEDDRVYLAYWAILTFAYGASIREGATTVAGPGMAIGRGVDLGALPPERFPNVVAAAPAIAASGPDEQFEYGLDRMLDGIRQDLASSAAR
jgi:AcrR family transcriptional regulator